MGASIPKIAAPHTGEYSMSLTEDQVKLLEVPFPIDDHEFVTSNPYLKKAAIRRRLSQIDSGWQLSPPEILRGKRGVVIVRGSLTLCGVTRADIGTGIIRQVNPDANGVISDYDQNRNVVQAVKTAASDILPRCAFQFGVGWYLKELPRANNKHTITTRAALVDYLKTLPSAHWAINGAGTRFSALRAQLGLDSEVVRLQLEPGRVLRSLTDTTLTETDALFRLFQLASNPTSIIS